MAVRSTFTTSSKFSPLTLLLVYFLLGLGIWCAVKNFDLLERFNRSLQGFDVVLVYKGQIFGFNVDNESSEEFSNDGSEKYGTDDFSKEFNFSILPDKTFCRVAKNLTHPSVFVVIKSRPYEYFQRMAIRQTYGQLFAHRLVFVVGIFSDEPEVNNGVDLEARQFGDILRVDFSDTYHNLGYKSLAILRWITVYCPCESFYLQADSDALLYPKNILAFAREKSSLRRHIYGTCWLRAPVLRHGKWRVSMRRLTNSHYPFYCSGAAYLMTGDVPAALLGQLTVPARSTDSNRDDRQCRPESVKIRHGSTGHLGSVSSSPIKESDGAAALNRQSQRPLDFDGISTARHGFDASTATVKIRTATPVPYMSIDDAFFSGLLADRALIRRINYEGFASRDQLRTASRTAKNPSKKCAPGPYRTLLASFEYKSPDDLLRAWENYQRVDALC